MGFFRRELGPVERFESALREKQAARQKLVDRLSLTEAALAEKRTAAERLAVAGAANAKLDRAEADMRAVEERAKTQRAALAEFDEQIVSTERALADAKAQRDRNVVADGIEAMAAAIERAIPGFDAGAAALVGAVTNSASPMPEATQVLDQRRCVASRGSRGRGPDLLGAAIRRGAHARGQRQRCDAHEPSRSNRRRRRSSGN